MKPTAEQALIAAVGEWWRLRMMAHSDPTKYLDRAYDAYLKATRPPEPITGYVLLDNDNNPNGGSPWGFTVAPKSDQWTPADRGSVWQVDVTFVRRVKP